MDIGELYVIGTVFIVTYERSKIWMLYFVRYLKIPDLRRSLIVYCANPSHKIMHLASIYLSLIDIYRGLSPSDYITHDFTFLWIDAKQQYACIELTLSAVLL